MVRPICSTIAASAERLGQHPLIGIGDPSLHRAIRDTAEYAPSARSASASVRNGTAWQECLSPTAMICTGVVADDARTSAPSGTRVTSAWCHCITRRDGCKPAGQRMGEASAVEFHLAKADFGLGRQARLRRPALRARSCRPRQTPKIGPVAMIRPFADRRLLVHQPRMGVGLPHIHGAAHDQQKIIRGERWNRFTPVQHDDVELGSLLAQEVAVTGRAVHRPYAGRQGHVGSSEVFPKAKMTVGTRAYNGCHANRKIAFSAAIL